MQNILIVDDRAENLLVLETILAQPDVNIVRVVSGKEALWNLLRDEFALVILDVQMPEMDGFETASFIRSNNKTRTVPIIFISAVSIEEKFISKGYEIGAVDYLVKPVDDAILKSKVNAFLALHKQKQLITEHSELLRKANEELEKEIRIIFEQAPIGINIIELTSGRLVKFNQTFCNITGYSHDELSTLTWQNITHPDDIAQQLDGLKRLYSGSLSVFSTEKRYIRKDSNIVWVSFKCIPLCVRENKLTLSLAIVEDITYKKQMEDIIKTERDKLKSIMDTMEDGIYIVTKDNDIDFINKSLLKEFGEVNGRKCYEYFHDRTQQCPWCKNNEVFAGKSVTWEWHSSKNNKTYSLFDTPLRNIDESIYKFEIFHDISDIKKAQAIMKRELDFQRAVAEVSEALLSPEMDIDDISVIVNKQAMKLTESLHGYVSETDRSAPEQTVSQYNVDNRYLRLAFPKDNDGYDALWGYAIDTKQAFYTNNPKEHTAYKCCIPEGNIPVKRFMCVPAIIKNNLIGNIALSNAERDYTDEDLNIIQRLAAIYAIAIDRKRMDEDLKTLNCNLEAMVKAETEKRQNQEQMLIQQSKMASMGEMIGLIAHQWRQPLNAIGLNIQDLGETYSCGEINDKYVEDIVGSTMNQINFMSKTIDDFKNFFIPAKEKQLFNVKTAIEELLSMFVHVFNRSKIHISIKTEQDALLVTEGYPNEFKQVVLNILNNSRDAVVTKKKNAPEINGWIELSINNNEGKSKVIVSIKDNGGGIPESIKERIFEPYFTTKGAGGTGIGLYMSKTIIETNMGGSLTVRNCDSGAEVRIEI
ncbi:MAG: PAS domain S-box protein [Nitrospirae bacterium]|nr:PAS domain S-box protein [Nitrospirota bacterium]